MGVKLGPLTQWLSPIVWWSWSYPQSHLTLSLIISYCVMILELSSITSYIIGDYLLLCDDPGAILNHILHYRWLSPIVWWSWSYPQSHLTLSVIITYCVMILELSSITSYIIGDYHLLCDDPGAILNHILHYQWLSPIVWWSWSYPQSHLTLSLIISYCVMILELSSITSYIISDYLWTFFVINLCLFTFSVHFTSGDTFVALLSPAAPKARDGRYCNAPRPSVRLSVRPSVRHV